MIQSKNLVSLVAKRNTYYVLVNFICYFYDVWVSKFWEHFNSK